MFNITFSNWAGRALFLKKSKTLHSDYENRKEIKNALGEGGVKYIHMLYF